jgi:serine/threonine protein kinase
VYRARGTNLRRDVALKTLPPALANDADRLARFQREAELLASLNHPASEEDGWPDERVRR